MQYVMVDIIVSGDYQRSLAAMRLLTNKPVMDNALNAACGAVAVASARELSSNILTGRVTRKPLTFASQRKRNIGKYPGKGGPYIPAYRGSIPLNRTGSYARSIVALQRGTMRWVVGIWDKKGIYSGSPTINIAQYAQNLEFGFEKDIPLTMRMLAYILILYGVIHGPFRGDAIDMKLSRVVKVRIPPRPVWRISWEMLKRWALDRFFDTFTKQLGSGLFSGKP